MSIHVSSRRRGLGEHDPSQHGCKYIGNNTWDCGHIDGLGSDEKCNCDWCQGSFRSNPSKGDANSAPVRIAWRKIPSVMTGGKPFFWIADTPEGTARVVWDRIRLKWLVQIGDRPAIGYFDDQISGKKHIEGRYSESRGNPAPGKRSYDLKAEIRSAKSSGKRPYVAELKIPLRREYHYFGGWFLDDEEAMNAVRTEATQRGRVIVVHEIDIPKRSDWVLPPWTVKRTIYTEKQRFSRENPKLYGPYPRHLMREHLLQPPRETKEEERTYRVPRSSRRRDEDHPYRSQGPPRTNPESGGRGWEIGSASPRTARFQRRRPERQRPSGKQYEYWPGAMDISHPNMLRGDPIASGSKVRITNNRVDPLGKIVWIVDEFGNEQSIWRKALQPIGTGNKFGRMNPRRKRIQPADPQTGWWEISYTIEPDEGSLDHIAEKIEEGYTQGEIINGNGRSGWWDVTFDGIQPDEVSLEHVGDSIREGYTEGEVINRDILEPGQRI